jgi:hypothetical protein
MRQMCWLLRQWNRLIITGMLFFPFVDTVYSSILSLLLIIPIDDNDDAPTHAGVGIVPRHMFSVHENIIIMIIANSRDNRGDNGMDMGDRWDDVAHEGGTRPTHINLCRLNHWRDTKNDVIKECLQETTAQTGTTG